MSALKKGTPKGVRDMNTGDSEKAIRDNFTQLYSDYHGAIYKFCLARLEGNTKAAEDAMQNAFIVLYKKMQRKEEIEFPRAFLYRIADKQVLKARTEIGRHRQNISLDEYGDAAIDNQEKIDSDLDYSLLITKISEGLSEEELELLKLKYIYELTIDEAAERLGISKPAAAKRLQRLREKIKNNYTKGVINDDA